MSVAPLYLVSVSKPSVPPADILIEEFWYCVGTPREISLRYSTGLKVIVVVPSYVSSVAEKWA